MKLDDLDRLIANLSEESAAGQSDEYARGLMADASAVLDRYRTSCRLSNAIGIVLDAAQALCVVAVPKTDMINTLRTKGQLMRQAAHELLVARNASDMPEARKTPEDLAQRVITDYCIAQGSNLAQFMAEAIREDRLETEARK